MVQKSEMFLTELEIAIVQCVELLSQAHSRRRRVTEQPLALHLRGLSLRLLGCTRKHNTRTDPSDHDFDRPKENTTLRVRSA